MLRDHTWAEPFLRQAAEALPECQAELLDAAACYASVSRTRAQAEAVIDDLFSPSAMAAIADPGARARYAELVLQIAGHEEAAARAIEMVLRRAGG